MSFYHYYVRRMINWQTGSGDSTGTVGCELQHHHAVASSLCVMPLSRRLALSHTETAGGVRSIIVVLVEISMEKNTRFSIFSYYTETAIFFEILLSHQ